jgi:hypothetical protein
MLKAMIAGETDAEKLAALGHERLGCTRAELVEVLTRCVEGQRDRLHRNDNR